MILSFGNGNMIQNMGLFMLGFNCFEYFMNIMMDKLQLIVEYFCNFRFRWS